MVFGDGWLETHLMQNDVVGGRELKVRISRSFCFDVLFLEPNSMNLERELVHCTNASEGRVDIEENCETAILSFTLGSQFQCASVKWKLRHWMNISEGVSEWVIDFSYLSSMINLFKYVRVWIPCIRKLQHHLFHPQCFATSTRFANLLWGVS